MPRARLFPAVLVVGLVGILLAGASALADDTPSPTPTASTATPAPTTDPPPVTPSAPATDPTADPAATDPASQPATVPATPGAAPALPTPRRVLPLRKGHLGPFVANAQNRLAWLGYEISEANVDGESFGKSTANAVRAFQSKHWLPVTGKIDKRTWKKLAVMSAPVGVLPRRCTEAKVTLCIDKTARVLRYVVKGKVKMIADARFGAPGMETGEGIFTVKDKSYNHVSSLYGSWMPRAMFFNGDEAVHYSPDFASVGYSRGSHGCIGLRDMEKATWLFDQVPVGTRVYVYWS